MNLKCYIYVILEHSEKNIFLTDFSDDNTSNLLLIETHFYKEH